MRAFAKAVHRYVYLGSSVAIRVAKRGEITITYVEDAKKSSFPIST